MATGSEKAKTIEQEAAALLKAGPLSAVALRQQLAKQGYERPVITKTLKTIDWTEQAARAAEREFSDLEISPDLLSANLAGRGFTAGERQKAVYSLDWSVRSGQYIYELLLHAPLAEEAVRRQLTTEGFTPEQIEAGLKLSPVDWSGILDAAIAEMLRMGASRKGIVSRLEGYGHSADEVRRRLRQKRVNWNEEALRAYLSMSFGRLWNYDWFDMDPREMDFTASQIEHVRKSLTENSSALSALIAEVYMDARAVSRGDMREALKIAEFSSRTITEALSLVNGVEWTKAAFGPMREMFRLDRFASKEEAEDKFLEIGYSSAQIAYAFTQLKPDWKERAYQSIIAHEKHPGILTRSFMKTVLTDLGFTQQQTEWALKKRYGNADANEWCYSRACFMGVDFPSKKAIRGALSHGGFSKSVVDDAVRRLWFDWREHAFRTAERLVETGKQTGRMPYPSTILKYLTDAGFTKTDIKGVIEKLPVSWAQIAAEVIEDEKNSCCGMSYIENLLTERQFPPQDIEEGKRLAHADRINWKEQAKFSLAKALEFQYQAPQQIRQTMLERGLTEEEVDYAFAHTVIPQNIDWNERALALAREIESELHLASRELRAKLKDCNLSKEQIDYAMKHIRLNLSREAELRGAAMLNAGVTPTMVPFGLRAAGFTPRHVRSAIEALGLYDFLDDNDV